MPYSFMHIKYTYFQNERRKADKKGRTHLPRKEITNDHRGQGSK